MKKLFNKLWFYPYPIHPCGLVYAGRLELAGEDVFGTLTGVMLPRLRLLTLLL